MKYLIWLSLLFASLYTKGQGLSLEMAIEEGLKNRTELKNQLLSIEKNQTEIEQLQATWKPQVSANADLRWNTQLQTTILPFDITGQNPEGNSELQFGLPFNNLLGLNAEQKIYDANKKVDLKLNGQNEEIEKINLEGLKKDISRAITQAYYQALLQKETLFYKQKQLDRLQVDFNNAQVEYKEGTLLENDLLRFQLDFNNAKVSLEKAQESYEIDLLALKNEMKVDLASEVVLSSTLSALLESVKAQMANIQPQESTETKLEEARSTLFELQKDKAKAGIKPTVSAFGNYSLLQLNEQFNPFQSGTWFPFNYVGLRVNIPIFNGNQVRVSEKSLAIDQQISRNKVSNFESEYAFQRLSAQKEIQNAQSDMETAKANIELGEKVFATSQFQFQNGVITSAQLKNSEYALQAAQENYLQAVYQFLIADIKVKEAFGLF